MQTSKIFVITLGIGLLTNQAMVSYANHAWGKYHWDLSTTQTQSDPLDLGDNTNTLEWNKSLEIASSDWNNSVIKNEVSIGLSNLNCDPTNGRVEVCNSEYGENGWLGIASIWITRGKENHITQGVVKLNDTYFNRPFYDSIAWRDFVMCQEVGHTFGLGHQDENFFNANLGSCMDYTDDPAGTVYGQSNNLHPNAHDYEELESIYAHLNATDTNPDGGGNTRGGGRKPKKAGPEEHHTPHDPSEWGQAIRQDAQGRSSLYYRELASGQVLITHVLWAISE